MNQHNSHSDPSEKSTSFWKSGGGVALIMLGLVVAFYLIREHWTHLGRSWPYLLLLMCPLMHLFMHGGHGHGGHRGPGHSGPTVRPRSSSKEDDDNIA